MDPEQDPDLHQFADKPKCVEYEPTWALIQDFEPLFGSLELEPDPHQHEESDPDPHPRQIKIRIRIRIRIRVISRIRIRITVMWIHHTFPTRFAISGIFFAGTEIFSLCLNFFEILFIADFRPNQCSGSATFWDGSGWSSSVISRVPTRFPPLVATLLCSSDPYGTRILDYGSCSGSCSFCQRLKRNQHEISNFCILQYLHESSKIASH